MSSSVPPFGRSLFYDVVHFIRPYRWRFLLTLLMLLAAEIANLYPAWALGRMTTLIAGRLGNRPAGGAAETLFWQLLGSWAVLGLVHFALRELGQFQALQLAHRISLDSRLAALRHMFSLDLAWHEQENTGNRLKRLANGEGGIYQLVRMLFINVVPAMVSMVGMVLILRTLSPGLSWASLGFVVTFYLLSLWATQRARAQAREVHVREEEVEGLGFQILGNITTIQALHLGAALLRLYDFAVTRMMDSIRRRIFRYRVREGLTSLYTTVFRLAASAWIGWGIFHRDYEIGLLVMFNAYFEQLVRATTDMAMVSNEVQIQTVAVQRLVTILSAPPTLAAAGQQPMPSDWQQISLVDLSFRYGERPVLSHLDLTLRRGERIGIVGVSGAGKTTLFQILLRLRESYSGQVLIDGTPLSEIDRASYLSRLAVVLQETEVFNMPLAANVEIAGPEEEMLSPEERRRRLDEALAIANLHELTAKLPDGEQTWVGAKGVRLSGGEKQRLGIARAVYRRPDVLLLDEATSNLDAHSEQLIQQSLERLFGQVTAVVIAHRLSTVRFMDRIVVLEAGQVIEEGTFDELLERRGPFYHLWNKQMKPDDLAAAAVVRG
jgi:ABC-type multidrug transport system fused ATPase/permease subunit